MTDEELLSNVAKILKLNPVLIKPELETHKSNAVAKLYQATLPFWIKTRQPLSLTGAAGDYLINMQSQFPNYWQLRKAQVVGYKPMDILSEGKFGELYPDDTIGGIPSIAVALDNYDVQFYPRPNVAVTIVISYFYSPGLQTITEIPSLWQYIIQDFILAMMWPDQMARPAMLRSFEKGLDTLAANARPFVDGAIDIIQSPDNVAIYTSMGDIR